MAAKADLKAIIEKHNIKACLFDLDGTMIDSMNLWRDIDKRYIAEHDIDYDPDQLQREIAGITMAQTAEYIHKKFNTKESPAELIDLWNSQALQWYTSEATLREGLKEVLDYLKAMGIKMAIASSNGTFLIEKVMASTGLNDYMETFACSEEVKHGKPAPDVYLLAASKIGAAPENCLVFEDIVEGVMAGKNAGMTVCVFNDPYSAYQWEEKLKISDYYIENYCEIL